MPPTDRELSDRFERRYGAIDAEIPSTPAFSAPSQRGTRSGVRRAQRLFVVVAAVLVVVVLAAPNLGLLPMAQNPSSSHDSTPAATRQPDAAFPTQVQGLPVVSVARALDLIQRGELDGRAVAVAGYYAAMYPPCPPTIQYIGPLVQWCGRTTFADTAAEAQLCRSIPNGTECRPPSGIYISPFLMAETSGNAAFNESGWGQDQPIASILIGHAGDLRQWLCTAETQETCANAFVVDRVAWVAGHDVRVAAPETGDQQFGTPITPSMSLDQVVAAAGLGDGAVTAAPFEAGDMATIDPRLTRVGDDIVWVVRSIAPGAPGDPTRPELLWTVDDTSGSVGGPWLGVDSGYLPARIWQQATVHGHECCNWDVMPYSRIESVSSGPLHQGYISGGASGGGDANSDTIIGGGYGSTPLILPAGQYTVTVWLEAAPGATSVPRQECSVQLFVELSASYAFNADSPLDQGNFPLDQPCTIGPAEVPTSDPTQ